MNDDEIFTRCAQRRRAIADLLDGLDDAQLATPSLCAGWDVRTVAAHLTLALTVPKARFGLSVLRHRGNFDAAADAHARGAARQPAADIAATLRANAESRFTPPLHGPSAPLTELCVHSGDIRAPLGLALDVTPDEAEVAFDLLTGFSVAFLPRGRLRGLRLVPDGIERTWGDGATVYGAPGEMLMAILGRRSFLDALTGPGRELLATRL